jgi:hypothetical protein
MSRFEGPQGIVTNGLVLNLDAGDPDSYTRSQPPYVEVLVVAGGGGTGYDVGGGGGAGGVIYNSAYQITNAAAITVTIGAGGGSGQVFNSRGTNGNNSVFGSLTAIGGGAGGGYADPSIAPGLDGGSGGGGGNYQSAAGGNGTPGQGFNGGSSAAGTWGSGGGGGAGGPGANGIANQTVAGGAYVTYTISGQSENYAGGGFGAFDSQTLRPTGQDSNGTTLGTYGFGANGTGAPNNSPYSGNQGIVIVRYPGLPAATGGTITYLNGYTIHTFTTSGTFTPYLWNDVTGNNRNATLNGTVTASMQTNGGILSVYNPSGTSQPDFFNFSPGSTSGYNPLNYANCSVTVAFRWNATNDFWERVFDFGRGGNNSGTYGFNAFIFTRYSTTSDLHIITHGGPSNVNVKIGELNIGTWQIYTITWTAGSQIYYKNGSVYTNTTSVGSLVDYFGATRTDEQYYLGKSNWNDAGARISYGAFMIHNRVLSAAEVTQMYNALKNRYGL